MVSHQMQTKSSALFYPEHASGFAVRQFGLYARSVIACQIANSECASHTDLGYYHVQTVYQHHAQVVHVPAGWLHQVENWQDCVKIA